MSYDFDFANWRQKSRALADQAIEAFKGQAAGVTDQAVRGAVDQALRVLSVAVDQVKTKEPPPPSVSIGVGMSLGVFYLEMQVHVPEGGPPGELAAKLKQAAGDDAAKAGGGGVGGDDDDVP